MGVRGFATGSTYRVTLAIVEVGEFSVADLAALGAHDRSSLTTLLGRVEEAGGHPALPEPQRLAVAHPGAGPAGERLVLAHDGGTLWGCAVLTPAPDGSVVLHVAVDPERAERGTAAPGGDDAETILIRRALAETLPANVVHLWVMQAGPADDARAETLGFTSERDVLQMRVPLPLPAAVVAASRPIATRPFVPGRDEGPWVDTNNRAFAGHPEQGGWTIAQLQERMAADWVELAGSLVADDPDGAGFIGFCWTKVHRHHTPVLGEIYVIAVDPRHHGHGWGRSLTVAGLESLAQRGIRVGMLYTDADNEAAVSLYRSLGFVVDHVDRSYRRSLGGD